MTAFTSNSLYLSLKCTCQQQQKSEQFKPYFQSYWRINAHDGMIFKHGVPLHT